MIRCSPGNLEKNGHLQELSPGKDVIAGIPLSVPQNYYPKFSPKLWSLCCSPQNEQIENKNGIRSYFFFSDYEVPQRKRRYFM